MSENEPEEPATPSGADDPESLAYWDSWFDELIEQAEEEPAADTSPDQTETDEEAESGEEEAEPVYERLEEWVQFYFLPMFRRVEGGENKWCRQWWRHTEAIARLDAMWRSWETLRLDEQVGMSVWFRDHADHHLPLLMGQNGPFRQCAGERHRESDPLDADWAPDGWWDEEED